MVGVQWLVPDSNITNTAQEFCFYNFLWNFWLNMAD